MLPLIPTKWLLSHTINVRLPFNTTLSCRLAQRKLLFMTKILRALDEGFYTARNFSHDYYFFTINSLHFLNTWIFFDNLINLFFIIVINVSLFNFPADTCYQIIKILTQYNILSFIISSILIVWVHNSSHDSLMSYFWLFLSLSYHLR